MAESAVIVKPFLSKGNCSCYAGLMKRAVTFFLIGLGLGLGARVHAELVITELMAISDGELTDRDGEVSDWIEITNTGNEAIDLSGYALTDDREFLGKWLFPNGHVLESGEYLIVFASGKDQMGLLDRELHTNFKLSGDGEFLALVEPDGETITHAFDPGYPEQRKGVSYGVDVETGEAHYFDDATPGNANGSGVLGFTADPEFSIARGFHTEPFELVLTSATEGARIRYTTNGGVPSLLTARTYTEPIVIDKTTTLRANASKGGLQTSKLVTHTFIFVDDVLQQKDVSPPGAHWDAEMDPEVVNDTDQTWSVAEALTSIPTLSVVAKDADLFGSDGIYKRPDRRGFEVPCSAEYFFPEGYEGHRGGDGFAIDCGIAINGNFSRLTENPKHSFRLKFKDIYGKAKLRYPLFPERGTETFDTITIRTGHNQGWATGHPSTQMMRNQFARDLQGMDPNHFTSRGHWVHLYLNGLYWGLYNFHERPDDSFGAENYGGDKDEYDAFKGLRAGGSSQALMIAGNRTAWAELFQRSGRDLSDPDNYESMIELVDVDQLIDYTIGLLYTGDLDGPTGLGVSATQPKNFYAMRQRDPAGRFRFFRWDSEFTLDRVSEDVSERRGTENPAKLHFEMRKNSEYRLRFADRVHRYLFNDGLLAPENVAAFYLERIAFIDKAIVAESARWGDSKRSRPYTRDVDWVRERDRIVNEWFPRRTEIVVNQFIKDGLYPDVDATEFRIGGQASGGGFFDSDSMLTLSSPDSSLLSPGTIYYTLDGSDPRDPDTGEVSDSAIVYDEAIALPAKVTVRSRVLKRLKGWSALSEATFITGTRSPERGDLVVSEIHYRPAAATEDEVALGFGQRQDFEFLELINVSEDAIDLTGLNFVEGIRFQFEEAKFTRMGPGERLVLVGSQAAFETRYGENLPLAGQFSGQLSNDGERIVLANADGDQVIDFSYNDTAPWPEAADGSGPSLVLVAPEPMSDLSAPDQWATSSIVGGTPGRADDDGQSGFDRWLERHFGEQASEPTIAATTSDPDGDGVINGVEYVLNSDPKDGASVPNIEIREGILTYRRNNQTDATDVLIETSTDLLEWELFDGMTSEPLPNQDGTITIEARIVAPAFARLRVRLP
ncbi:MAG: lamin tail domain-containing protein [Verrucomicrobiales bacterium]